jgi:hypothetical protein
MKINGFRNSSFLIRWGTFSSIRRSVLHGHGCKQKHNTTKGNTGRVIPQVVSHILPTAAARVRSKVKSRGIYGGQNDTGEGFLWVLRFPLAILIPPNAPYSSIIWGWYSRPISGRRTKSIQSHPTKAKVKKRQHRLSRISRMDSNRVPNLGLQFKPERFRDIENLFRSWPWSGNKLQSV